MVRVSVCTLASRAFFVFLGCTAQSAPPAPSNLQCPEDFDWNPGELAVEVDVDPFSVDMVSFMVARTDDPERWPSVQYSVPVGNDHSFTVRGIIPGLEAGAEYFLMARAHTRNQTTGYYIFWSDVAHREIPCKAAGAGSYVTANRALAANMNAVDTMWIEGFRYNGNGASVNGVDPKNNITLPDYIEGHNVGDFNAVFSDKWSTMYDPDLVMNGSITRYCIEMQAVELHGVTTPTDWVPSTSPFADYNTCTAGKCHCMDRIDREVTRQPLEPMVALCGEPGPEHVPGHPDDAEHQQCECPAERQAESEKYIGMVHRFANGGRWYSMPPGVVCAPGARVGDAGCTYRLSPLSHSVSVGNLYSKGVFDEDSWWKYTWLNTARAVFDDLGALTCGGATHKQIMV